MKKSSVFISWLLIVVFGSIDIGYCQRPLINHIYAADPSAHVWPADTNTLWLYTSHDVPGTNHHATMFDYHVFSTKDLINWVDYGRVLSVDDVDWAIIWAWAVDAVYRHGKYYLIFCMMEKATGIFRTGLAISDVPQGPFTNIGFIQGVENGQDPAVFVDDNNTAYLYWGGGGHCYGAQLTDDLKSIVVQTKVELTQQLFEVFEGPWLHKYNSKYYLSYPGLANGEWPEEMYYAIAEKPLGPFTYSGKYIPKFNGQAGTNHGSIVQYKNKWIAFYHNAGLSGGNSANRNLLADFLYYNSDGSIKTIVPDTAGITNGKTTKSIILLEAENGKTAGGRLEGTKAETLTAGYSGKGYVTGFDVRHNYVEVLVQVANDIKAKLSIRLSAQEDVLADVLVGVTMLDGWSGTKIKKTNGWQEVDFGEVQLKAGDNKIHFSLLKNSVFKIDYFKLEPLN